MFQIIYSNLAFNFVQIYLNVDFNLDVAVGWFIVIFDIHQDKKLIFLPQIQSKSPF
jgi:hypothetical protein